MRPCRAVPQALFGVSILVLAMAFVAPASAALYSPARGLPTQTIQDFLANPSSLLSQFPNGGPLMITKVRDLVATDPATLAPLIGLLKTATPEQASSIGTALGQVALMAVATDQAFATEIQKQVTQSGNTSALVAFSAVVGGDIKLSATAPGAGLGGGGESQTTPSSGFGGFYGGGPLALTTSAANTADSFTLPIFSPGTPGTIPTAVSPF